jgi:3-oxoacyl-[acyl-carrier protein] reductase
METAGSGVSVSIVNPGAMDTERFRRIWSDRPGGLQRMLDTIPAGRLGDLDQIAGFVGHVIGEMGTYATGATFDLNGGRVMY